MSFLRRAAALLAMVAAALGMVLVAPTAQAQTPEIAPPSALADPVADPNWTWSVIFLPQDCVRYRVCVWTGPNFTGFGLVLNGNVVPGDCVTWFDTVWNDDIESAQNKGTAHVTFYDIHGDDWIDLGSLYPGYDFRSGWPNANKPNGLCAYHKT